MNRGCRLLIKEIKLAQGEIQFLKPNRSGESIDKCVSVCVFVCVYRVGCSSALTKSLMANNARRARCVCGSIICFDLAGKQT